MAVVIAEMTRLRIEKKQSQIEEFEARVHRRITSSTTLRKDREGEVLQILNHENTGSDDKALVVHDHTRKHYNKRDALATCTSYTNVIERQRRERDALNVAKVREVARLEERRKIQSTIAAQKRKERVIRLVTLPTIASSRLSSLLYDYIERKH